jgi:3-oxoacyl-[acyl-carrier protein] reductase
MNGKVLITGTSRGIGRATASLFLSKGYEVIGIDKDPWVILDKNYTHHQVDIREADRLPVLTDIKYIINNAGVLYDREEPMSNNVYGTFNVEDAYVSRNLETLEAIVNLSSIAALDGQDEREYVCSKGALISYTKYLANELAFHGVRVNCIIPGAGETEMNLLYIEDPDVYEAVEQQNLVGRWGQPEECARAIYFMCVDATFTTGETLLVDGGELVKNRYVRGKGETRPYDWG